MEKFRARALSNKVGNTFDPDTFQGPQVSRQQFDRVMGYIEGGKAAGVRLEVGGKQIGSKGYYIEPTIFSNVNDEMAIVQQEIFGPVCTVRRSSRTKTWLSALLTIRLTVKPPYTIHVG